MKPDKLYRIVHSLSQEEQGEFSRSFKSSGRQFGFVRLFHAICSSNDPTLNDLSRQFKSHTEYYEARRFLKKHLEVYLVERSLSTDKKGVQLFLLANEYRKRGLSDLSNSTIRKGKKYLKDASSREENGLLFGFLEQLNAELGQEDFEKEIARFKEERRRIDTIEILAAKLKQGLRERKNSDLTSVFVIAILEELRPIQQDPPATNQGKIKYLRLLKDLYFRSDQHSKAIQSAQEAVDLLEQEVRSGNAAYKSELINEISSLAFLHKYYGDSSIYERVLSQILFFPADNPSLEALKYQKHTLPLLIHALDTANFEIGDREAVRLTSFLIENPNLLPPKEQLICHFFLAKFHFWKDDQNAVAQSLIDFHHLKSQAKIRYQRLGPYVQLLEIFSLIERGEFDLAFSRSSTLKRLLKKQKVASDYFQLSMEAISVLIKTPSKRDLGKLEDYFDQIIKTSKSQRAKDHFTFFNPIPFLESKLQQTSAKDAFVRWTQNLPVPKSQKG